jgi:hypothetical protein
MRRTAPRHCSGGYEARRNPSGRFHAKQNSFTVEHKRADADAVGCLNDQWVMIGPVVSVGRESFINGWPVRSINRGVTSLREVMHTRPSLTSTPAAAFLRQWGEGLVF